MCPCSWYSLLFLKRDKRNEAKKKRIAFYMKNESITHREKRASQNLRGHPSSCCGIAWDCDWSFLSCSLSKLEQKKCQRGKYDLSYIAAHWSKQILLIFITAELSWLLWTKIIWKLHVVSANKEISTSGSTD